jgi:antitoxin component of MazEF toxin-antitoxin module
MKIKIIKIGNSNGIILSREILRHLKLNEGDYLHAAIHDNPPGIILRTVENELQLIGLSSRERSELDAFLDSYREILEGLK